MEADGTDIVRRPFRLGCRENDRGRADLGRRLLTALLKNPRGSQSGIHGGFVWHAAGFAVRRINDPPGNN